MIYGDRLRFIRKFRGLTQKELAEKCNLGKHGHIFIAQYENGSRVPKKKRNECIAKALGISPKVLMWDTDCPHEDICYQLCWAFILPEIDYPLALMHQITVQEKIFVREYEKVDKGEISEMEYVSNKIDFMNGINNITEV